MSEQFATMWLMERHEKEHSSWNAMRKNVMQGVTDTKESGSPQQHRRQQTQRTRPCQKIG